MSANTFSGSFVAASTQYSSIINNGGITGGHITIEAWVNPTSLGSGGLKCVAYQGDVGTHTAYWIRYTNSNVSVIRERGGIGDVHANWTNTLTTGTWIHLVLIDNGTTLKLYSALASDSSHTERASVSTDTGNGSGFCGSGLGIAIDYSDGTGAPGTARVPDGLIDDVRFYNAALSIATVDADFKQQLVGNETNLVAYYEMNNNWNDTTANAFNLTAVNTPTFSSNVPFTGIVGPANVKTYNGLAAANVKTINGLAIASVKTFNGLN